jgi:hypothetical protein
MLLAVSRHFLFAPLLVVTALTGCARSGELVVGQGGAGITAVRTKCPAVGIPDYTGDITLFRPGGQQFASDLDVTAAITNLRATCNEAGERVYSEATFDVFARRADTWGARQVSLPYFVTVLRGGSAVVSKQVGTVTVDFADGAERGRGSGRAGAYILAAEATLPEEIREQITRERKAGDPDAALDPLADPTVRAAVQRATFEMLVGFNLSQQQLAYNVTR